MLENDSVRGCFNIGTIVWSVSLKQTRWIVITRLTVTAIGKSMMKKTFIYVYTVLDSVNICKVHVLTSSSEHKIYVIKLFELNRTLWRVYE